MNMKAFAVLSLVGSLLFAPVSVRAEPGNDDVDVLSKQLLEPMNTRQLKRHLDAVFVRRQSRSEYTVGPNTTRIWYTYSIQMPDGSLMQLPETYDVTQVAQHAQRGIYNDLTLYDVHRAGTHQKPFEVGVTGDSVILLDDKASN